MSNIIQIYSKRDQRIMNGFDQLIGDYEKTLLASIRRLNLAPRCAHQFFMEDKGREEINMMRVKALQVMTPKTIFYVDKGEKINEKI